MQCLDGAAALIPGGTLSANPLTPRPRVARVSADKACASTRFCAAERAENTGCPEGGISLLGGAQGLPVDDDTVGISL